MDNDDLMKEEVNRLGGYMDVRLHVEKGKTLQLRVPTMWNSTLHMWTAFYKFSSGKIISGHGKDSFELTNNFNNNLKKYIENDGAEDVLKSFKEIK